MGIREDVIAADTMGKHFDVDAILCHSRQSVSSCWHSKTLSLAAVWIVGVKIVWEMLKIKFTIRRSLGCTLAGKKL